MTGYCFIMTIQYIYIRNTITPLHTFIHTHTGVYKHVNRFIFRQHSHPNICMKCNTYIHCVHKHDDCFYVGSLWSLHQYSNDKFMIKFTAHIFIPTCTLLIASKWLIVITQMQLQNATSCFKTFAFISQHTKLELLRLKRQKERERAKEKERRAHQEKRKLFKSSYRAPTPQVSLGCGGGPWADTVM